MDIGYLTGVSVRMNNLNVKAPVSEAVQNREEIPEVVALVHEMQDATEKASVQRRKGKWESPVLIVGLSEIKKNQGLSEDAPVFIERRHTMKAVPVERRKIAQNRTILAEDATGMNSYQRATRTNQVGEYYRQKCTKTAPKDGERFTLHA